MIAQWHYVSYTDIHRQIWEIVTHHTKHTNQEHTMELENLTVQNMQAGTLA